MDKIKRTMIIEKYIEECPHCHKKIIGTSEGQVKFNLKSHIQFKHKVITKSKK